MTWLNYKNGFYIPIWLKFLCVSKIFLLYLFCSKDFVIYAGGSVWALDWCPRVHEKPDCQVKCEVIVVYILGFVWLWHNVCEIWFLILHHHQNLVKFLFGCQFCKKLLYTWFNPKLTYWSLVHLLGFLACYWWPQLTSLYTISALANSENFLFFF